MVGGQSETELTSIIVCAHTMFMVVLSEYSSLSASSPAMVFKRWTDPRSWPEWDPEVRQVDFDSVATLGAAGKLRPSRGPSLGFLVTELQVNSVFTNTSALPGARLDFTHIVDVSGDGSRITVSIRIRGPLASLWGLLLKRPLSSAAKSSVEGLIGHLENEA